MEQLTQERASSILVHIRLLVGMVKRAMVVILAPGVELPLTLATRILDHSRKVSVFHVCLHIKHPGIHMSTNVALELSDVCSLADLFNVVVQVKLFSLSENLIACILVHLLNRDLGGVHQLTGIQLPFHIFICIVFSEEDHFCSVCP